MKKLLLSLLLISSLLADTVTYNQKVIQANPQTDKSGNESFNTIFGELTVGERTDNINVQFQYNNGIGIDTVETLTGTATTSNAESMASLNTGTGVGVAKLRSRDTNRYITGHECIAMFTSLHPTPEPNTYTKHVYGDDDNAIGYGYNTSGVFGIWTTYDGVTTHIPITEWSEKLPEGFTLNPDKLNIYAVSFGWLGIAPIQFKIYGGKKYGWILVHVEDTPNKQGRPHLGNPVLPIQAEIGRVSGIGANLSLKTASWRAGIIGKPPEGTLIDRPNQLFITKTITGGLVDTPIVSIKNPVTFEGKINHIRVRYGTVNIATDGTKAVKIKVFSNGTLTTPTWVDFDPNNSPAQYDISSNTHTGGKLIGGALSGKVDQKNIFGNDVIIAIYPGETVTLTGSSANSSEVEIFLRVLSEF